jgi:hypothetical protein
MNQFLCSLVAEYLIVAGVASAQATAMGNAKHNAIYYASRFSGADVGAQINAADLEAGSTAADIWVTVPGTVTTVPIIRSSHRLILKAPLKWDVGLMLNSNTEILGTGQSAVQTLNLKSAWVTATVLSGLAINDVWFENLNAGADPGTTILHCIACTGVLMEGNHALRIGLIRTDTSAANYSEVTSANISQNVTLNNNFVDGQGNQVVLAYLQYVKNVFAKNNVVYNAQYNVEWWGGNAAVEGMKALNPRWASNIKVTGGVANNVRAGFWGSMGQDISVTGVTVDTCQDVGVDAESSSRVVFSGFTVHNCANGGLAVFFSSQDNEFGPGAVTSDTASSPLLFAHNASFDPTMSTGVKIHNVKFICANHSTMCALTVDPIGSFQFSDNEVKNAVLKFTGTNNSGYEILRNRFSYTFAPVAFNAITVPGQVANYKKTSTIAENTFHSSIKQPAGTFAISATITDFNYSDILYVRNNKTQGFVNDAHFVAKSSNPGMRPTFVLSGNTWGGNSVTNTK